MANLSSAMSQFNSLFGASKALIGMVHIQALPGTPQSKHPIDKIIEMALTEAAIFANHNYHAIIIENMHDVPYCKNHSSPEIIASMSVIAHEIKKATRLPLGIQILAAANEAALAAAKASHADFIRAEGFVFSHIADEGMIDGCAGPLMRYRKHIDAESVAVFTDIKKKHAAHAITSDIDILETAKAAEFFLSDGVIITGSSTGRPASIEELKALNNKINLPVLIGSGINHQNLKDYFPYANGFIVGSSLKQSGFWSNPIDENAVQQLSEQFQGLINSEGNE